MNDSRVSNEPPVIALSIKVQYSEDAGEWVASSETHPGLEGHGVSADDAFRDACACSVDVFKH